MSGPATSRADAASASTRHLVEERREQLLDAITDILLAEGFAHLTMDTLAARLRCSKATLYAIAGTKSQLVVAVTKRFFAHATRSIEESVRDEADPERRIKVYLRGIGRQMDRHSPAFYEDMVGFPPTAAVYELNARAASVRVRELLADGMRSGRFRSIDARFAAELVVLAIEGVRSGALLEHSGLRAGEAFAELGDLLVDGLSGPSPRTA